MTNTTITIKFSDGSTRDYEVNDDIEREIQSGKPFTMRSRHPEYGEVMEINPLAEQ